MKLWQPLIGYIGVSNLPAVLRFSKIFFYSTLISTVLNFKPLEDIKNHS